MARKNASTLRKRLQGGSSTHRSRQYTIRSVPDEVDRALRAESRRCGRSLNEVALEALRRGTGVESFSRRYDDLDALVGSWVEDAEFDRAMRAQRQIDPEIWR